MGRLDFLAIGVSNAASRFQFVEEVDESTTQMDLVYTHRAAAAEVAAPAVKVDAEICAGVRAREIRRETSHQESEL